MRGSRYLLIRSTGHRRHAPVSPIFPLSPSFSAFDSGEIQRALVPAVHRRFTVHDSGKILVVKNRLYCSYAKAHKELQEIVKALTAKDELLTTFESEFVLVTRDEKGGSGLWRVSKVPDDTEEALENTRKFPFRWRCSNSDLESEGKTLEDMTSISDIKEISKCGLTAVTYTQDAAVKLASYLLKARSDRLNFQIIPFEAGNPAFINSGLYAVTLSENSTFRFPESWQGLGGRNLEQQTGQPGLLFCAQTGLFILAESMMDALTFGKIAYEQVSNSILLPAFNDISSSGVLVMDRYLTNWQKQLFTYEAGSDANGTRAILAVFPQENKSQGKIRINRKQLHAKTHLVKCIPMIQCEKPKLAQLDSNADLRLQSRVAEDIQVCRHMIPILFRGKTLDEVMRLNPNVKSLMFSKFKNDAKDIKFDISGTMASCPTRALALALANTLINLDQILFNLD